MLRILPVSGLLTVCAVLGIPSGCRPSAAGTSCPCRPKTSAPRSPDPAADTTGDRPGLPAKVIFLARHGRTAMNRVGWINGQMADDGLDALGFKQRVGLLLLLRREPVSAIFVSQLKRSQQTAEPLAAHFKLRPVVVPELNEFQGGIFQGMCKAFLRGRARNAREAGCDATSGDPMVKSAEKFLRAEAVRSVGKGIQYRAPGGGESVEDVARRLKRFARRFPLRLRDKAVVIIGHGGTNRFLLANLMGWPLQSVRRIRQKHTQVFRLERTGPKSTPRLSIYWKGKWTRCDRPPAPATGLDCMSIP